MWGKINLPCVLAAKKHEGAVQMGYESFESPRALGIAQYPPVIIPFVSGNISMPIVVVTLK